MESNAIEQQKKAMNDKEDLGQPSKTVKFNVGGKPYEVSRSLIDSYPDTMLARLISDTWQSDPHKTIFIERDGERFRYILDYMRDQQVHLPPTVSKASMLNDLAYFGFDGAQLDEVNDGCGLAEVAKQMAQCEKQFQDDMQRSIKERIYLQIAHQCFLRYSRTGDLPEFCIRDFQFNSESSSDVDYAFGYSAGGSFDRELFDECLARRGLEYVTHRLNENGYLCVTLRLLGASPKSSTG